MKFKCSVDCINEYILAPIFNFKKLDECKLLWVSPPPQFSFIAFYLFTAFK